MMTMAEVVDDGKPRNPEFGARPQRREHRGEGDSMPSGWQPIAWGMR
jgi:hypothetical protein